MRLLTVKEVAEALNCSVTHVYNLIGSGTLAAQNISAPGKRRSWRIDPDALDAFRTERNAEEVVGGKG